jgi:hypothetical protein
MKKQLYRAAAATVLGLSLTTGIAAAQTSGTIHQTGADSYNKVSSRVHNQRYVNNDNDVRLSTSNHQYATSGDATSRRNTTSGNVGTGTATNTRSVSASLMVDNSASSGAGAVMANTNTTGRISNTGYNSTNVVKSTVDNKTVVNNDNDICVTSTNTQNATSGDATATENTTVGNVTTGSASNTSSENFVISVKN